MKNGNKKLLKIRWQLVFYDLILLLVLSVLLLAVYKDSEVIPVVDIINYIIVSVISIFGVRILCGTYRQIWRYGGIQSYVRLLISDCIAFIITVVAEKIILKNNIHFLRILAISSLNLLGVLATRMIYRYAYKYADSETALGIFLNYLIIIFAGKKIGKEKKDTAQKIKIAIIGAGRVGVGLAEEILNNPTSAYIPRCFVDTNKNKVGRSIQNIPVISEDDATFEHFKELEIQEVVFAIPYSDDKRRKVLYNYYKNAGYKIKVYDFPTMRIAGGKRHLREFDIEELLFRKPLVVVDNATRDYYKDKVILITGGGGSIGSELCRQIAKMSPRKIIVLDIYENGAYDVQQELKIAYRGYLDLCVEIVSICNRVGLERVFAEYRPQIVLNAAAHKHVPLMEKNCIEAVENNVFGTLNIVEFSEKYDVERVIMISSDKAVNPTNIMGATKRMCEMIVQSYAATSKNTTFSATRFGNVLGSAGSVIPLFKRQIANGGPVTITDKRIIRYFMTIPEASQLVLTSGAMAKNGELFVLDMGEPVKILEMAENMIRISGFEPYKDIDIIETGLRPGEKLYEELLVKTENLDKTDNRMIFIERDQPISKQELEEKLNILRNAIMYNDDETVRKAMYVVVPTYKTPETINAKATEFAEMQGKKDTAIV